MPVNRDLLPHQKIKTLSVLDPVKRTIIKKKYLIKLNTKDRVKLNRACFSYFNTNIKPSPLFLHKINYLLPTKLNTILIFIFFFLI